MKIVFAAGCFWGVEKYFSKLDGVIKTTSGYCGGDYDDPTYKLVLKHRGNTDIVNYVEAVMVEYDKSIISAKDLLQHFWQSHNPTQGNQQGNDVGNNYRSGVYCTNNYQLNIAKKTKDIYQYLLSKQGFNDITTEILALDKFHKAEQYHQNYLVKNPNGYCPNHSTGVDFVMDKINYKDFAKVKFGKNSELYSVGFANGTDARFCQKYDKFQQTPNGFFIDKISGEKLFSTNNRFNSGSGWLSFYRAISKNVVEKIDNSHNMQRTEVLAKTTGMHLGHVFDEGFIDGKRRFCINASVLDFFSE